MTLRGISAVTEKNIRIYYTKAPVLIFGLLFPFFMFIAFYMGRNISFQTFYPGFLAMSLFFTASSVGPLITPWEKSFRTYERLLSFPVTVFIILLGDVAAGMVFGIIVNIAVLAGGLAFIRYSIHYLSLFLGIIFGSFCFSTLGVLLSSFSARAPSNVMMLSSLIRFPMIFISGIFVPMQGMQGALKVIGFISPLTYLVDLLNYGLRGDSLLHPSISSGILVGFTVLFLFCSLVAHKKNLLKGL
jgi:ABC-2 type transport system permease protein